MIAFLRGKIKEKTAHGLVLDVDGVGYEVLMSTHSLSKIPADGEQASVHTYLHVREDQMQLFGFCEKPEKKLFELLISVSGIGPKVALAVLSAFSVEAFERAVQSNDIEMITAIPGIGKKGAQRLVLELKDKITFSTTEPGQIGSFGESSKSAFSEARAALISLGYSVPEAMASLEAFPHDLEAATAEDLIKYGLKNLAGG